MANKKSVAEKKTPKKAEIEKELKDTQKALADATDLIKELKKQIENQSAIQPQVVVQTDKKSTSKIKCINLAHNPLNISTLPNGGGRIYTFEEYGQAHFIKYDDLLDIVSSYPKTIESGMVYIADRDFCEEQGIYDDINKVFTKELMDEVVYLRTDKDVDLLCGMSKPLLESTMTEIARLYAHGEYMEANKLEEIRKRLGYDIPKIAENVELLEKPSDN